MKKSQLFALMGFLLGWGAPVGALVLKFVWLRFPSAPLDFKDQEWSREPFLYWYMLVGTCLVLAGAGYVLGKFQDREDLRNRMRVDEAIRDALTGLATHRRLHEVFASEYRRHLDSKQPLSCLMLDLDEFRKVNEAYGYAFGDTILKDFAQLLRNCLRQGDTASRYGGEEFFCILPDCAEANAMAVAERVRTETEKLVFPLGKTPVKITVSIGVVTVHDIRQPDYYFLVAESDKNLYKAKSQGRNRTVQSVFHEMAGAVR
jgi:diguanylate cyclase (GGDEF)-like protein